MVCAKAAFWWDMEVNRKIIEILKNGGIGVLPTDTIYGVVGSVWQRKTVERIYKLRKRDPKKPMIVLIAGLKDLDLFDIKLSELNFDSLKKFWPGKVSVILSCPTPSEGSDKLSYLHRGVKSLAFRLPKPKWLRDLLKKTGPLIATSANPESMPSAETIKEAKAYFGEDVDFYVDVGKLAGLPSTLIEIKGDEAVIRRQGVAKI